MTIPRRLDPDTGPPRALPDFRRSAGTIERMLQALDHGPELSTQERPAASGAAGAGRGPVRVTTSRIVVRSALLRTAIAALWLWAALVPGVLGLLLLLRVPEGHAPDLAVVVVVAGLGLGALVLLLAALRWGVLALAAVRSRLERDAEAVTVFGAFGSRRVPWREILGVDSRAVHPVHGVSAALLLRGGGRVVMPLFDRPVWTYAQPSRREIRELRAEIVRRAGKDGGRAWKP